MGAAQRGGHGVPDHPADAVPGAEVLPQPPVPGGRAAVGPGEALGVDGAVLGVSSSLRSGLSGLARPPGWGLWQVLFAKSRRREELAGGAEEEVNPRLRNVPIALATGQRQATAI